MTRAALGLALILALAGVAGGQEPFRITYDVDRSNARQTIVSGTVRNEGRLDAVDVYVTAEALDRTGKVVARGIAFVSPAIPQGREAGFTASVPNVPAAASYRVRVSAYRLGFGAQSP